LYCYIWSEATEGRFADWLFREDSWSDGFRSVDGHVLVLLAFITVLIERIEPVLDPLWRPSYVDLGIVVLVSLEFPHWRAGRGWDLNRLP
jgi:hypothetical protein